MSRLSTLVFAMLWAGCAESQLANYDLPADAEVVDTPRALRLDVYPPGNLDLLPQSFTLLPNDIEEVYLALAPTVRVRGFIEGAVPSPVDITIPSDESEPVEARITIEVPGTIMRGVTTSAPDGRFNLDLPAGFGYRAVAVALEPYDLPLYIEDDLILGDETPLDIVLGLGVPVSGEVVQDDGSLLPAGARVHLVDNYTGEAGPVDLITASGEYLLRGLPGDYTLILEGDAGGSIPTIPWPVSITTDEIAVRLDLDPGQLAVASVSGAVIDSDGRPVDDAEVRFTAVSLEGLPADATARVATDSDRNGLFTRQLARGTWLMEVIPLYAPGNTLSPATRTITVADSSMDLGEVMVRRYANLDARVYIGGAPARNIVLNAVEQGFNRYTYTATSDVDGWVNLQVPDVPLDLTLQSPDSDQPITRLEAALPGDVSRIDLDDEGSLVAGILLDPNGAPLPYALVEIRDHEGVLMGTTLTDGDGAFRVTVALIEDFELDSGP
jgi:hypothetical protein